MAVLVLAAAARAAYGPGDIGYDGARALVWGHEIAHGHLPSYGAARAPTPHPLYTLVCVPLSLLGERAYDAAVLLVYVAFGALAFAAFRLGRACFSTGVGIVFAAILLTRPLLVGEAQEAYVDLPFLALVVWAAALEAEAPGERETVVLALLGAATLLRPEGVLFAAAYGVYRGAGRPRRDQVRIAALVAAAPIVWAASDWIVTGDPLFSLRDTQQLALGIRSPRGFAASLSATPRYLRELLGAPLVWTGIAGGLLGLWRLYRRSLVAAGVAGIGLLTFLALGVLRIALLPRYLLVTGVGLGLFAGVALLGWRLVQRRTVRVAWALTAVTLAAFIVAGAGDTRRSLAAYTDFVDGRRMARQDLLWLMRVPAVRQASRACGGYVVTDGRSVSFVMLALDRGPSAMRRSFPPGRPARGLVVLASPRAADLTSLRGPNGLAIEPTLPPGFRRVAGDALWTVYERC